MYKFVAKIIAKRYLEKHKTGNKIVGVTNTIIKGIDVYKDMSIYILLYIIISIIIWIGVPIGSYFLFDDNPFLWTFFIFMIVTIFLGIFSFKLAFNFADSVRNEIQTLYNNIKDAG